MTVNTTAQTDVVDITCATEFPCYLVLLTKQTDALGGEVDGCLLESHSQHSVKVLYAGNNHLMALRIFGKSHAEPGEGLSIVTNHLALAGKTGLSPYAELKCKENGYVRC